MDSLFGLDIDLADDRNVSGASKVSNKNGPLLMPALPEHHIATPLPDVGIASAMGPNETHVYSFDHNRINYTVSLSECSREPLDSGPLTLISGNFNASTKYGGLLSIFNSTELDMLNSTLVVKSPAVNESEAMWFYQLGIDSSASYTSDLASLYWVDSDFSSSLFVTMDYKNMSKGLQSTPYSMFVNQSDLNSTTEKFTLYLQNANNTEGLKGLTNAEYSALSPGNFTTNLSPLYRSYCAMKNSALLNQNNCDFSTTNRSTNHSNPVDKGQFLFKGLNRSSHYAIQLGIPPPDDKPVGGVLFPPVPFITKESMSCQLIYNLSTCPDTAFSVPGNPSKFTHYELAQIYDEYVKGYYQNFTHALNQVNCNASKENRYSVFSTCDDCASAYLDWVCTVAVPRCADWEDPAHYLVERPINNSRNAMINDVIQPEPYKEIMPCYWLCNNLAMYCPISMEFSCPSERYMNLSYGSPSDNGDVSCSYPGAVYYPDGAWMARPPWLILFICLMITFL